MNEDFTIVPNSYKCQGCRQVGDTPLKIEHKEGCPTVEKELRNRTIDCIDRAIASKLHGLYVHNLTGWPGSRTVAELVFSSLKAQGFLK